eukprot:15333320-Ditylum_brightwellii.AAC.3
MGQQISLKYTINGVHSMMVEEHYSLYDDRAEQDEKIDTSASEIKGVSYEAASAKEVADQQKHMSSMY